MRKNLTKRQKLLGAICLIGCLAAGGNVVTTEASTQITTVSATEITTEVAPQMKAEAAIQITTEVHTVDLEQITTKAAYTGWKKENNLWHYYKNGTKYYGWLEYKGDWYYLNRQKNGAMAANEVLQVSNSLYCFNTDGIMETGWSKVGGLTYYAKKNGILSLGWIKLEGHWYYFEKSKGNLLKNTVFTEFGKKYFLKDDGSMAIGWIKANGKWYYAQSNGVLYKGSLTLGDKTYYLSPDTCVMVTGWTRIDGTWYFYDAGGVRKTGWLKSGTSWYYLNADGTMAVGWLKDQGHWYFMKQSGSMTSGWAEVGGQWYYFKEDGTMVTGWQSLGRNWYYFSAGGIMQKGWLSYNNRKYYLDENGKLITGWKELDSNWYYFDGEGRMSIGWMKSAGNWYYLKADGIMAVGWMKLSGSWYYLKNSGVMATGWIKDKGYEYYLQSNGIMATSTYISGKYYVDAGGKYQANVPPKEAIGAKTIKGLLLNAIQPIGKSLYIYGGGHDDKDSTRIGINATWVTWYKQNSGSYSPKGYEYKYGYGLDCSGFIGWGIYNTINTKSGGQSVTTSSTGAPKYYGDKGWGTYSRVTSAKPIYKAGDVVSIEGHVWFIMGQCADGSVVICHATPNYTQLASSVDWNGTYDSQARRLVQRYMPFYYNDIYTKFGMKITTVGKTYLTNVNRFEWKTSGGILTDPQGYKNKSAEAILKDMFST